MELLIAVGIGLAIFLAALWMVRLLSIPAPDEPDPDEVHDTSVDYRCTVCGLRLTVTAAQDGDTEPPKHCREEMVPA